MGLLLSVLITCVGVLEVIACYTQFRIGTAYNECKSNLRDVAKYYAVELRKHELHFEPGPENGGPSTSQDTLSELMSKRTVRIQERSQLYSNGQIKNGQILSSSSVTPENGTPNPAANLIAPRNSICGYDSPTVQTLTPELDITEAVEKIQNLDMTRKSRSHISRKTGLEVVEKDFWRSRSPSPYPESKDSGVELIHTPSIKKYSDIPTLLENSDIEGSFPHSPVEIVDKDFWSKPQMLTQESWESTYSKTDLEVQNITENMQKQPETFFGITEETAENEETKFDEAFLRSLDGVNRSSKCDDRRRSFRKKRNSSSTSSRASEISRSSKDILDDIEKSETDNKKISPLTEEEIVTPEKCDSITSPVPKEEATFSKQEQTLFQANVAPNTSQQESSAPGKNICFTEKVKDLEISVQLLVTVKGTSQGDKMEYTTTVNQDKSQKAVDTIAEKEEITKTTEEKSEFGNVKTSVTYGNSITPNPPKTDIKDLQISSQSLIHAERTTLDDVASTEAEFLKLYESYTELPDGQKDQFLKIIGQTKPEIENIENISDEPKSNNTKLPEKIEVSKTESDNKNESRVGRTDTNILDISVLDNQTDNKSISSKEKWDQAPIGKNGKIEEQIVTQVSAVKPTINKEIIDKESPETEPKILSCETENLTIHEKLNNEITTNVNTLQTEVPTVETESNEVLIKSEIKKESVKIEEAIKVKPETKIIEEPQKLQTNEKSTKPEKESSSESSSTPSTVIENKLRRAAKTSFEDASSVQNQEMLTRRVSNHEISPKQASQAFWLIFSAEYTNAMEKDWHGQHFSCWQCDESLTGQRYVLRDDHPYCVKCYEQVFANPCEKCNRIIGIDSKDLSYKDKHWHEACFQCTTCNESLVDKQFGAKGEKIYCGNCYDKQFASRCDGCGKIFHAGTKKMEYKNRQWHEQCFKCCKCETPIGTKSFIPREKDIYCAGCYEEKFATRCVKCDKAIQSGGVTYKNEPWHRECFTCTHCNKNLAGQRFTSRDDKPCCAECFGRLFAKRCTSCSEPITGIGGTRFISFEDRHWHNDCFICASCSTSLVGRGFITDEDKIICPECAKERFM